MAGSAVAFANRLGRLLPDHEDSVAQRLCKCLFVPVLFGLYVLWLGADANWDLTNYHLYNPYALFNGKAATDFAAAGMQSYFSPVLDLLPYGLGRLLPPRLAGFLMGALHGLAFLLIYAIASRIWPWRSEPGYRLGAALVASVGVLTANFLSEVGNSMGDDSTALLVLLGLWLTLRQVERLADASLRSAWTLLSAGLCFGLATGLKLTNAPYAVAFCVALLLMPVDSLARVRLALLFGIGVLVGLGLSDGPWLWLMTERTGNPLYPQFGTIFPHPFAAAVAAADTRFLPKSVLEALFWPFIFSARPHRVGELSNHQIIWPIAYLLVLALALRAVARLRRSSRAQRLPPAPLEPGQRLLLAFVVIGYLVWLKLFSIARYLVPIEVLLPLLVAVLLSRLFGKGMSQRLSVWLLGASALVVIAGGAGNWGHEPWADPLYHAEVPKLDQPERSTVVLYSGPNAWGWIATQFPASVAFIGVQRSFPEGPGFVDHIAAIAAARGGPVFALIDGVADSRQAQRNAARAWLERLGVSHLPSRCKRLQQISALLRLKGPFAEAAKQSDCGLPAVDDSAELERANQALALAARTMLMRYRLTLDVNSCAIYHAGIGTQQRAFQWCSVEPGGPGRTRY